MLRYGLLPGVFDPVMVSHVMAAAWSRSMLGLERVLVLPVEHPPIGAASADYYHRVQMTRIAFDPHPYCQVVAFSNGQVDPALLPETENCCLLIGREMAGSIENWHDISSISNVEMRIMPVDDSAVEAGGIVRGSLANHKSSIVPDVMTYIRENRLYGKRMGRPDFETLSKKYVTLSPGIETDIKRITGVDDSNVKSLVTETVKFLWLASIMPSLTPSAPVDACWKFMILRTNVYVPFCLANFGRMVHRPAGPIGTRSYENTLRMYRVRIGKMPDEFWEGCAK